MSGVITAHEVATPYPAAPATDLQPDPNTPVSTEPASSGHETGTPFPAAHSTALQPDPNTPTQGHPQQQQRNQDSRRTGREGREGRNDRGRGRRDGRDGREGRENREARPEQIQPAGRSSGVRKVLLLNACESGEIRVVILENGELSEVFIERKSNRQLTGNIYKGRIVNIEPSLQAAFVDLGSERNGFLHVSDCIYPDGGMGEMLRPIPPPVFKPIAPKPELPQLIEGAAPQPAPEGLQPLDVQHVVDPVTGLPVQSAPIVAAAPAIDPQTGLPLPPPLPMGAAPGQPFGQGQHGRRRRRRRGGRGRFGRQRANPAAPMVNPAAPQELGQVAAAEILSGTPIVPATLDGVNSPLASDQDDDFEDADDVEIAEEHSEAQAVPAPHSTPVTPVEDTDDTPVHTLAPEHEEPQPEQDELVEAPEIDTPTELHSESHADTESHDPFQTEIVENDADTHAPDIQALAESPIELASSELVSADTQALTVPPAHDGQASADAQQSGVQSRRPQQDRQRRERPREDRHERRMSIQEVFKKGQEVLVQVAKEGLGQKGPALTTYLSLPGRYLVLMPAVQRLGVSKRIGDEDQRRELKDILNDLRPPEGMGLIVRTAGMGRGREELQRDFSFLVNTWNTLVDKTHTSKAPQLIFEEGDVVTRVFRDIYSDDVAEIVVDSPEVYERAKAFLSEVAPGAENKLRLYQGQEPLFHKFNVEPQLHRLFHRKVNLKSGGSIVIEQTEALMAIDVNTGRHRERSSQDETILATNLEAAREIARQLRLRDIGGLVMIDFIDMENQEHKRRVERELRMHLARDKARINVLQISSLGIVEMTRQRMRHSLRKTYFERCPHCAGSGHVKSPESMTLDVMRELRGMISSSQSGPFRVTLNPAVALVILNRFRRTLANLEETYGVSVELAGDSALPPSQWKIWTARGDGEWVLRKVSEVDEYVRNN